MIAAGQLGQRQAPAAPRVICASRVRPRRVAAAACRSQAQPRRPGNIRAGAGDISQAALDTTHSGGHKISAAGSDMARVAVVTTLGCPYCKKAKAALQAAGFAYEEVDLAEHREALTRVKELTGQSTVPQIFVGGKLVGGASELLPLLEDGSFQQLLAETHGDPLPTAVREALPAQARGPGEGAAGPSAVLQQLAASLKEGGPARNAGPDGLFPLRAAVDWVAATLGVPPAMAIEQLASLQEAQLLTLPGVEGPHLATPPAQRPPPERHPILARILRSRLGPLPPQWQVRPDVAITEGLLAAEPEVQARMVGDGEPPARLGVPLNGHFRWFGPARPAAEVSESLRKALLQLYDRHMTPDGRKVDYAGLRADPYWRQFVDATAELQKVELRDLSREELIAFCINIYNALVVHATVAIGPAANALARGRWFGGIKYVIGGKEWSADELEHGVLRGNSPSPASLLALLGRPQWARPTFREGDARARLAVRPIDPRIHFALNCGANSCPPIKVYSPDNLELGLSEAAAAFCASEVEVFPERMEVKLSMILKWYGRDFGSKADLLRFLVQHLPPEPKQQLEGMLAQAQDVERDILFTYRPYDWGTNSK